jgi:putative PIN family toxin of toxin-antitoxin system
VSAVLSPRGVPAQLLSERYSRRFELIVSEALLAELSEVLLRAKFRSQLSETRAVQFVDEVRTSATPINDPPEARQVTQDPDDDYLIALAEVAAADVVVSGDHHLTDLVRVGKVSIVTPRSFLNQLNKSLPKDDIP